MVTRHGAAIFLLAGLLLAFAACGTAGEKVVGVSLVLPADWESVGL